MDPGAVLEALARPSEPWLARVGYYAVRPDRRHRHGRGLRARGGGAAHQGHQARPRDRDRLAAHASRSYDPALAARWRVAECATERRGHRRAAAGTDQLPELRRPRQAGGVLAARRVGARPGRSGAGTGHSRSPAATSACTTNRLSAASLPTAQIGVVGVLDDIDDLVRPQFAAARGHRRAARRDRPGHGRLCL